MAHVFQTILSVDVKEKAIAALISTLKMVHSAPLLIIDATGTSNRLPSEQDSKELDLSLFRAKDAKSPPRSPEVNFASSQVQAVKLKLLENGQS